MIQHPGSAAAHFSDASLSPMQIATAIGGLVDSLGSEKRLVEELIVIMRRQRDAVSQRHAGRR